MLLRIFVCAIVQVSPSLSLSLLTSSHFIMLVTIFIPSEGDEHEDAIRLSLSPSLSLSSPSKLVIYFPDFLRLPIIFVDPLPIQFSPSIHPSTWSICATLTSVSPPHCAIVSRPNEFVLALETTTSKLGLR